MQSGCTSEKERSIRHGFILDFSSTIRSWVNACFSKLHLGRVIYSNNTASHGTSRGKGLKRGQRSVKGLCHQGLWDTFSGKETIHQQLTGEEGAPWVIYNQHYVAFRPTAFAN